MKSKKTILVIDDEAVVCESFARILSNEGFKVDTQTKALEGLKLAKSHKYDLVFLDLKMEEMDGIELLYNLRAKDPDLPVIIVTGYPSIDTAKESFKLHVSDYILKPFTPEEILKSINQIIPDIGVPGIEVEPGLTKRLDDQKWEPSDKPFRFFEITWFRQGKDGSFRVGAQIPTYVADRISDLILPEVNDIVYRGLPLAAVVLNDKSNITIPSSLSGRVIDVNHKLKAIPSAIKQNEFDKCWIARIEPFEIEKDLQITPTRNVVFFSNSEEKENPYLTQLYDLGCTITRVNGVDRAIDALIKDKNKVIVIDALSLAENGPDYIHKMNQEIPEARVVVVDEPHSKLEELYRRNKILYYCIDSLFNKVITDILVSTFTSMNAVNKFESVQSSFLPQTICRIQITNKHNKKVSLLAFGDLLKKNKGIGYILFNNLIEQAFPVKVIHCIDCSESKYLSDQQRIENELDKNDRIITFQTKEMNKIPGQVLKEVGNYANIFRQDNSMINLLVQPNNKGGNGQLDFCNIATRAIAEFILTEMTKY